jgi:hypothetical protein
MQRFKAILCLCVFGVVAGQSGFASAQDAFSFTYSDLSGNFDIGSSLFTAVDDFDSDGDVTRLIDPMGDAFFAGTLANGGFASLAAFDLTLSMSNITASTADGVGSLMLVDLTGDEITADVTGDWFNNGSASFIGALANVTVVDHTGDGRFDGDNSSWFSLDFPGELTGNTIALAFGAWFTDDLGAPQGFSDVTTLASGAVVPEPATLTLLALGGWAVAARKRRS